MNMNGKLTKVTVNGIDFWFSYDTLVAVVRCGTYFVAENRWSGTTGKHLNYIDGGDKKNRLNKEAFEAKVKEIINQHSFDVPKITIY